MRKVIKLKSVCSLRALPFRGIVSLRALPLCGIALLLLLTTACDRRPLEVYFDKVVNVRLDVDWMTYFHEKPTGMTMLLYREDDGLLRSLTTNEVNTQVLRLEPDVYKLIIFNQSPDEFGSMRFENLASHYLAAARALPVTTRANRPWDLGEQYMADPEAIGVAVDTINITQEMTEDEYLQFVDYRQRNNIPDTIHYVFKETVNPMTTHLNVRVMVKGYQSMRSLEANISGMSDGFYMSRVDRTQETGKMILDTWTATPIEGEDNTGWVTTSISTFGLPFGKEKAENREPEDNVLHMAFLLKDGTIKEFVYNVGKIMKYLTPSGDALTKEEVLRDIEVEIIIDDPIDCPDLPPVDPSSDTGAGFDAHVDDWEYGGTIDIGF